MNPRISCQDKCQYSYLLLLISFHPKPKTPKFHSLRRSLSLSLRQQRILIILLHFCLVALYLVRYLDGLDVDEAEEEVGEETADEAEHCEYPEALPAQGAAVEEDEGDGDGRVYGAYEYQLHVAACEIHGRQVRSGEHDGLQEVILCEFCFGFCGEQVHEDQDEGAGDFGEGAPPKFVRGQNYVVVINTINKPVHKSGSASSCELSQNVEETEDSVEFALLDVADDVAECDQGVVVGAGNACTEHYYYEHAEN